MAFTYDSNIQEQEFPVLEPGEYNFEVVSAKEGTSKSSGKDMLTLTFDVFDNDGHKWEHKLYIVDTTAYHLKRFWESVGEPDMLEKLASNHDENAFIGKCGKLKTKLEDNEYNGETHKKSVISKFIKKDLNEKVVEGFEEDDIPF